MQTRFAHDFEQVERLGLVLSRLAPSPEVSVLLGEAHYEMGHFAQSEAVLEIQVIVSELLEIPLDRPETDGRIS